MDTSNNQDFRIIDLLTSQHPEDHELANRAIEVIGKLIEELKPVLRYIVAPVPVVDECTDADCLMPNFRRYMNVYGAGHRAIIFLPSIQLFDALFIDQNGSFFTANKCSNVSANFHYHPRLKRAEREPSAWQYVYFGLLLNFLRVALKAAEQKKEEHLESIRVRREKLDKIMKIING